MMFLRGAVVVLVLATGCSTITATEFSVGSCILLPGASLPFDANSEVPCDELHDFELYHALSFDEIDVRPTQEDPEVTELCLEKAIDLVDLSYFERGEIEFQLLIPDAENWNLGSRKVYCVADAIGHQRRGSVLVANQ